MIRELDDMSNRTTAIFLPRFFASFLVKVEKVFELSQAISKEHIIFINFSFFLHSSY